MRTVVDPPATAHGCDLGGLPAAARRALTADAIVVVEPRADGPLVLAAEGLARPETAAVLRVLADLEVTVGRDRCERVDVPGFRAALYVQAAPTDGTAAALCALRRESGTLGRTGLGVVFARHAACALAARRHRATAAPSAEPAVSADRLGTGLLEASGYEDLMRAVAEEVADVVGAPLAGILVWQEQAGILQLVPGSFGVDVESAASARAVPVDWASSAARVFTTGQPYITNDGAADRGVMADYVDAFGLSRIASLVLEAGDRRVGVLQVANKPADFTIADVHAAQQLAPRVATALEIVRTRLDLLRRHRLEEILGRIALDIAAGKNLQDFLGGALDDFSDATDVALIAVMPLAGEPMVWRRGDAHDDLEQIVLDEGRRARGLRANVVGSRGPGAAGWAALHVPIHLDDQHVATLSALRTRGEAFDPDERHALSRLANLTALGWATERYQRHQAQLARLSERQRIADELHDHIAQLLFGARISLESTLEVADVPDTVATSVARACDLIARGDMAIRQAIRQLAPPSDDDFATRLAATVGAVEEEFGHSVQLEISPAASAALDTLGPARSGLLTKVAREALVNAAKHAGPCQLAVRVTVTRRGRLLLSVTDDGVGVGRRRRDAGYGMAAMRRAVREHGGDLRLHAAATGGTRVSASLPL